MLVCISDCLSLVRIFCDILFWSAFEGLLLIDRHPIENNASAYRLSCHSSLPQIHRIPRCIIPSIATRA